MLRQLSRRIRIIDIAVLSFRVDSLATDMHAWNTQSGHLIDFFLWHAGGE